MEDGKMNNLSDMIWIELRKAIRSRMPLWTALGSLFIPLGIAFLLYVSKNPEIAQKLGLVSAKANLIAYAATDWPAYMQVYGEVIGAAGLILFILIITWIFGREFADGTLKDLLAVPIQRSSLILAKYIVAAIWSGALTMVIFLAGLVMGTIIRFPGGSIGVVLQGLVLVLTTACLVIPVVLPFALFASMGRGYLLPIGIAFLVMMMVNLAVIVGWGEYFPWAVPMIYAQGKTSLTPVSYWIVVLTGLAGVIATYFWLKYADQNR
jgi:ABC-2 type transport system permease protein